MISPIILSPGADMPTVINALNDNFRQIESENRTKVIRDESGVNRILIGRGPDGKYVMKVSKERIDVLTAKDADLIFNSNQNILKISKSGTHTIMPGDFNNVGGAFPYQASFSVDLTELTNDVDVPVAQVYVEFPFGYVATPYYNIDYAGDMNYYVISQVDALSLTVNVFSKTVLGPQLPLKYYIYQETVNQP